MKPTEGYTIQPKLSICNKKCDALLVKLTGFPWESSHLCTFVVVHRIVLILNNKGVTQIRSTKNGKHDNMNTIVKSKSSTKSKFPIQVPKPGPKSRSQIKSPKSKIHSPEERDWD